MSTLNSKTRKATVCAIVLNYLNHEQTFACVTDLLRQDSSDLEVVVVDNQSPNDSMSRLTEAFAHEPRVVILQSKENRGYAAGNNFGARWRISKGTVEYLLICNNDVRIPDPSTVRRMVDFAESKKDLGGLGPMVLTPNGFPQGPYRRPRVLLRTVRFLLPVFPVVYRIWRRRFRKTKAAPCYAVVGAFMLMKAGPFIQANLFDERTFLGAEEYILTERLRKAGYRFYHLPSIAVVHDHAHSAIVRTGGEVRHFQAGLASMMYYLREYRGVNGLSLRLFEASARFYGRIFLPVRRRFTI
jgi:GT2 family glycosyltransferase